MHIALLVNARVPVAGYGGTERVVTWLGRALLEQGHKVQVVCIFRGRQMAHPEHGYEVMRKVANTLGDISKVESPAKLMGRRMTMLLAHK